MNTGASSGEARNTLCTTLQHTLHHTATQSAPHCNTLCTTLQHTLHHTATHSAPHCNTLCTTLQLLLMKKIPSNTPTLRLAKVGKSLLRRGPQHTATHAPHCNYSSYLSFRRRGQSLTRGHAGHISGDSTIQKSSHFL